MPQQKETNLSEHYILSELPDSCMDKKIVLDNLSGKMISKTITTDAYGIPHGQRAVAGIRYASIISQINLVSRKWRRFFHQWSYLQRNTNV